MSLKFIAGFVDLNEKQKSDIDLKHTDNDIEKDGRVYEKQRDPPGMCRFIICIMFLCVMNWIKVFDNHKLIRLGA